MIRISAYLVFISCIVIGVARGDLTQQDPQTAQLFDQYFNGMTSWNGNTTDPNFVALLHGKDADLFFLQRLYSKSQIVSETCESGLVILKTDRSFMLLCNRLESEDADFAYMLPEAAKLEDDSDQSQWTSPIEEEINVTAQVIADFNQPQCVTPLLTELKTYINYPDIAEIMAKDLKSFQDPRIDPVLVSLIRYPQLRGNVISELLTRNSPYGAKEADQYFKSLSGDNDSNSQLWIVWSLGDNHHKEAVDTMLDILPIADKISIDPPEPVGILGQDIRSYLSPYMMLTNPWENCVNSGFMYYTGNPNESGRPAEYDTIAAINAWWKQYRNDFNDDMQLLTPQPGPELLAFPKGNGHTISPTAEILRYPPKDFNRDANKLSLSLELNAQQYRVGDPIRMDVTFENKSTMPSLVFLPEMPSSWPTMGFGYLIKDLSSGRTIFNASPSSFFLNAQNSLRAQSPSAQISLPPWPQILPPGAVYRQAVCLQYLLSWPHNLFPLAPGKYSLTFTFDPRTYNGIQKWGPEILASWQAPPVIFSVIEPPRTDPKDILDIIAKDVFDPRLFDDLKRPEPNQTEDTETTIEWSNHNFAVQAIWEYGDSRLTDYLTKLGWTSDELSGIRPFHSP